MYFWSAVLSGGLVLVICLVFKRLTSKNQPTTAFLIKSMLVVFVLNHLVVSGMMRGEWAQGMVHLLASCVGFVCYLYVVGDLAYYRNRYRSRSHSQYLTTAPEDDPNWPTYRP